MRKLMFLSARVDTICLSVLSPLRGSHVSHSPVGTTDHSAGNVSPCQKRKIEKNDKLICLIGKFTLLLQRQTFKFNTL